MSEEYGGGGGAAGARAGRATRAAPHPSSPLENVSPARSSASTAALLGPHTATSTQRCAAGACTSPESCNTRALSCTWQLKSAPPCRTENTRPGSSAPQRAPAPPSAPARRSDLSPA